MPVQYMFPVNRPGDSINSWLNSGGGSGLAYLNINEGTSTPTDSDYVIYQPGADENPEITFGRLVVVPSSISFTYRASGTATIDSVILRDTNNLTIASNTSIQNITGGFTNRTITLSGVNSTRNYANAHVYFHFSGTPNGVAFSAMDLRATGDIGTVTSVADLYLECTSLRAIRFPAQAGDRAWTSGFSSGFGGLPDEMMSLYTFGKTTSSLSADLYLEQNNIIIIRPSGDAGLSGIWINSSGNTTDMWDYVNDITDSTLLDSDYIYNIQSGIINRPDKLYWISDSGIFNSNLDGSNIGVVETNNSTILNSMHGCYDIINDFIYYGYEIGTQKRIGYHIVGPGYNNANLINNYGGGMCLDTKTNCLFTLSKEGYFHKINSNNSVTPLTFLAGNFRELYSRRLRIDEKNRHIYAIAQDQTSTLSRLYQYNIDSSGWTQLRTLSYGLFGGSFDIDVANSSIYYCASPSDLISNSFYGIVKENMYSGAGTRIIEPSGSAFFQCQELIVDTKNSGIYYVAQDNSTSSLNYRTVKTDLNGASPTTIHTIPEASGANVLLLNTGAYKSYIDFHLTDFAAQFGDPDNPYKTIRNAFVSAEIDNFNDYTYLNAKILRADKSDYIWYPVSRNTNISYSSADTSVIRIGKDSGYIHDFYNTNTEWDGAILRLELSSVNTNHSGNFRVYNSEVTITLNHNERELSTCNLYTIGQDIVSLDTYLWTMAGVSVGEVPLYTVSADHSSGNTTLFTNGMSLINNNTTLYTVSLAKEQSNMNLFISGLTPLQSEINTTLYSIGGSPNAVLHSPLYIQVDGAENRPYGKMNLFTTGTGGYPTTSRMNLFLKSDTITAGLSSPLFIANDSSGVNKFTTLYLKTNEHLEQSGNMNLFIARDTESLMHNTTLYVQVNSGTSSGIPLYLYAMTSSRSGVDLVVPNVVGHSGNNRTLYINGF